MARCLVLGANGFIGSHLVDALVQVGHDVRAFGRQKAEPLFDKSDQIELFSGDFLNKYDLTEALKNIDYVFHFISTTTPASAENDPLIDIETNIRMSVELLQLCVDTGVKSVIFASTGGAIYGEGGDTPCNENDTPYPVSPYAIGKLTIEHYLRYFKVKHGLNSTVLRISNPYGERQPLHRKQGVIPIFLENINEGLPLTVLGNGEMVRDYIYVRDLAKIIAHMFDKEAKYPVYNIGSGSGITVNEMVAAIEEVCHKKAEIITKPIPPTFVHKVILDTDRYIQEFGMPTFTPLAEGLTATLAYIQAQVGSHVQ